MDYIEIFNQKSEGTFYSLHFSGRHVCPPGHWYMGMRNHFLLHYVEEGVGMVGTSRANALTIHKGNCFLYPPHTKIYYKADKKKPWIYRWVAFSAGPRKRLMSLPGTSDPILIDTEPADGILPLLKEIWQTFENPQKDHPDRDEDLFLQILSLMINKVRHHGERQETITEYPREEGRPDYVTAVKDFIKMNFQHDINCSKVAAYTGLERSYLSRIFTEKEGMALKDYMRDIRMKEALRLLKETDFTITAVAKSVGYREYKSFARNFKARYGCSAGEIQERYRKR
jgi:AraC-like DNA-binding protein